MSALDPDEEVRRDFELSLKHCREQSYSSESIAAFECVIDCWISQPRFVRWQGLVRTITLNELTFLLFHEHLGGLVSRKIRELAAHTTEADEDSMRGSLTVSTFELAAEPPEHVQMLEFLFSMERDPATRWAIFRAHERWPGRFRRHIARYSDGSITESDYLQWLSSQGFILTARGIRRS